MSHVTILRFELLRTNIFNFVAPRALCKANNTHRRLSKYKYALLFAKESTDQQVLPVLRVQYRIYMCALH